MKQSAAVKLITYDFVESPYTLFSKYWSDHRQHYIFILGDDYDQIHNELIKLGHVE